MNGPYGLALLGSYAYVAMRESDTLAVIDISNPSSPSIVTSVSSYTHMGGAYSVAVEGSYESRAACHDMSSAKTRGTQPSAARRFARGTMRSAKTTFDRGHPCGMPHLCLCGIPIVEANELYICIFS